MSEFLYDERPPLTPAEIRQMFDLLTASASNLQKQITLVDEKVNVLIKQNEMHGEELTSIVKVMNFMSGVITGLVDRTIIDDKPKAG